MSGSDPATDELLERLRRRVADQLPGETVVVTRTLAAPPVAACGRCRNGGDRSGPCEGCDGLGMVKAAEAVVP